MLLHLTQWEFPVISGVQPVQIRTFIYLRVDRFIVDDGILQIINVSHEDQGTYTCRALTPLDEDTASAELIVLGK